MLTNDYFLNDFLITIPLFIWALFVMKYLSRWVYNFALKKGYPQHSATYFGRKIIHIFASGIIAFLIPFLYKKPFLPFISAIILGIYTYLPHKKEKLFQWYQVRENTYEVNFSIMWGLSILVGWYFDKTFWLGVVPVLFMSFGDGITGIVRNIKYKIRNKSWEGSLAMLIVCSLIGLKFGFAGIVAAAAATIVERFDDDNIWVPLVSLSILILFYKFFPILINPLF
jgi:dolichol kinase